MLLETSALRPQRPTQIQFKLKPIFFIFFKKKAVMTICVRIIPNLQLSKNQSNATTNGQCNLSNGIVSLSKGLRLSRQTLHNDTDCLLTRIRVKVDVH